MEEIILQILIFREKYQSLIIYQKILEAKISHKHLDNDLSNISCTHFELYKLVIYQFINGLINTKIELKLSFFWLINTKKLVTKLIELFFQS